MNGALAWGTYPFAGQPATRRCHFAERIFSRAIAAGVIDRGPHVIPIAAAQYPTAARRPGNSILNSDALSALGLSPPDWRAGPLSKSPYGEYLLRLLGEDHPADGAATCT